MEGVGSGYVGEVAAHLVHRSSSFVIVISVS